MENLIKIWRAAEDSFSLLKAALNSNAYSKAVVDQLIFAKDFIESYDYEAIAWKKVVITVMIVIYLWEVFLE
jgi:hypothetical protein